MPKLKPTDQQLFERRVINNIRAVADHGGVRFDSGIAKKICMSESTFSAKMNNPCRIYIGDLYRIAKAFRVPITELLKE